MPLTLNSFGLSQSGGTPSQFVVQPEGPYLNKTGIGTDEVTIGSLGQYNIDIYGDIQNYNPRDTPLLTILSNLGSEQMKGPVDTWIDEYEGDMWADIKLDDLRETTRNSGSYSNGKLAWKSVTTRPITGTNTTLGNAATEANLAAITATAEQPARTQALTIAFNTSDDYIRGQKREVIRKLTNLLDVFTYTKTEFTGSTELWTHYAYVAGTSYRVYMAFDDLALACGSSKTYYQKHEVIVGISDLYFDSDLSQFIIIVEFSDSNISELLDSTAANNTVLLEEVAATTGSVFDATHTAYYSRMSRLAFIGANYDVPSGVAEGANFTEKANFIYGQDQYLNYSQIFESGKYGITGTRQATQVRFKDEFQASRRRHLALYKNKIAAATMFGVQSVSYDPTTGLPVRTMSGFFDYGTFPIRYMKKSLPAIASGTQVGDVLRNWLDDIAYALAAHSQKGTDAFTLIVSRDVIKRLADWNAYIGSSESNVFGSTFQTIPPSTATLGLEVTEYVTRYARLRFIEDPGMNYMPTFRASTNSGTAGLNRGGAPAHLFPNGLNPRNMIVAFDKSHAQFLTLRNDLITGNLQDPGQDMFQEAIRGEHSLRVRFPRNHSIIDIS